MPTDLKTMQNNNLNASFDSLKISKSGIISSKYIENKDVKMLSKTYSFNNLRGNSFSPANIRIRVSFH